MTAAAPSEREVRIGAGLALPGVLSLVPRPKGLVIFAHGSGSGRLSPRNRYVAGQLNNRGFATLLFDLLTPAEESNRVNVFDIALLANRLALAADWVESSRELRGLPVGYFGASTGAGAALRAAARTDGRIAAVVSRGGRADLAGGGALVRVKAPTLLIVGSRDESVIELNEMALSLLKCPASLVIVPGAGHLFEEPGTLDQVVDLAADWFERHMKEALP